MVLCSLSLERMSLASLGKSKSSDRNILNFLPGLVISLIALEELLYTEMEQPRMSSTEQME
jgi:hypothetical protein